MTSEKEEEETHAVNEIKKLNITITEFKIGVEIAKARGKIVKIKKSLKIVPYTPIEDIINGKK